MWLKVTKHIRSIHEYLAIKVVNDEIEASYRIEVRLIDKDKTLIEMCISHISQDIDDELLNNGLIAISTILSGNVDMENRQYRQAKGNKEARVLDLYTENNLVVKIIKF